MSIPAYADLRRAVHDAAEPLDHPTKGNYLRRNRDTGEMEDSGRPHKYGRVVYFDGGHVGCYLDGAFWIAEGDDHEDSILALAHKIGATKLDPKVAVRKVSAERFVARSRGDR